MCVHVIFTSPAAHLGQLSALTSVDASITSKEHWLDVTHSNPSGPCPGLIIHTYTHCHRNTQVHNPPTCLWVSCCSCASWCRRLRAFSCLRWSFHDFEATLRANSLCLSSFSLCRKWKVRRIQGGTEKVCGGQGFARKVQTWDKERRKTEIRKLSAGSHLSSHTHQPAAFVADLLQSSGPINSIQPLRKCLFSKAQQTQPRWWILDYRNSWDE